MVRRSETPEGLTEMKFGFTDIEPSRPTVMQQSGRCARETCHLISAEQSQNIREIG
jgi:hypothetical protein